MCTTPIENNSKVSILDQYFLIEVKIIKEGYDMIVGGNLKKNVWYRSESVIFRCVSDLTYKSDFG